MEIKAEQLEVITEFEGYAVGKYRGQLGIWALYTEKIDWEATFASEETIYLDTPTAMAAQLKGDCGQLLDFAHFQNHLAEMKAEAAYLAKLEA